MANHIQSQTIHFPNDSRKDYDQSNKQALTVEGFRKKINLGNYYNQEAANGSKISFEIISTSIKKKLSEVMFDIPYFMKEIDFYSKYENNISLILLRDLDLSPSNQVFIGIKEYVFSNSKREVVKKRLDKENNMNLGNVEDKSMNKMTSDINLNFKSEKGNSIKNKPNKKKFINKPRETRNFFLQDYYK